MHVLDAVLVSSHGCFLFPEYPMYVSMKVRPKLMLAAAALALTAACSDAPIAPRSQDAAALASRRPTGNGATLSRDAFFGYSFQFTIDPSRGQTLLFGPHKVSLPAYSVCDPATSSYGDGYWDAPCTALQTPLLVTATFTLKDDHAYIDFQPSLRFVPASADDRSHWVVLTLREYEGIAANSEYEILWQRPLDGSWVDESAQDPTMEAWIDPTTNSVSRRIKHFSGYNVTAGFVAEAAEASDYMTVLNW